MEQEISLTTPIDAEFTFTEELETFLAEKIKHSCLSKGLPMPTSAFFHTKNYLVVVPLFFACSTADMVHFELRKHNDESGAWSWGLHFETYGLANLKLEGCTTDQLSKTISDMIKAFQSIFPLGQDKANLNWIKWQRQNSAIIFNSSQPIKSIADALLVFDMFYDLVVEKMSKADIRFIKLECPRAFDSFKLVKLHTLPNCNDQENKDGQNNKILYQFVPKTEK